MTAGKLKLGSVVAKQLGQNRAEVFCALLLCYSAEALQITHFANLGH